ncbi:MAG: chemotaxis protein CheB [Pseudomonadota bacterium]
MKDDVAQQFIVGVGASAGGLEAIRALLKSAPNDAPASYVIAQHMSPTQRSMLQPLIARETHLQVEEISDPVVPLKNTVYVAPPNADVIFDEGMLKLVPPSNEIAAPKPSVDRLFRTLAEGVGSLAIGVVLSGTGSDGSAGVKAIREAGGITFAQDDKTAKYDGMPNSALETGCIDLILSPVEIGKRLESLSLTVPRLAEVMKGDDDQTPLAEILQIVLAKTRVDFRDYKPTTILRRLERRMIALGMANQRDYAAYCREHDEEIEALYRDFLISVTRFFRDPEEYAELKPLIEQMVDYIPARPIRIWVAGCATGEEAYSIAIMFCEALGGLKKGRERGIQIFATDIDDNALRVARSGRYSLGSLNDVPQAFINQYFDVSDTSAMVHPDLKSMILFSLHNVIQDPPFMNIDMICCRNLLIYFGPVLQDRAFANFHYSLGDRGLVFLGTADSAGVSPDLFKETETGKKFLRKRVNHGVNYSKRARHVPYSARPSVEALPKFDGGEDEDLRPPERINAMVRALVASLGRNALLLTRDLSIVEIFGDLTQFISIKGGRTRLEFDHNLLIEPLAAEVRVLSTMLDENQASRRGFKRKFEHASGEVVQLEMFLLNDPDLREDLFLVVFHSLGAADQDVSTAPADDALAKKYPEDVQALRDELTLTRDALNQTVERWETTNEELKSANEELQSNNEELQSVNEELETSNEELQSTNEELVTVNEAYQVQADELNEVNEELDAILTQIEVPLVIFDLKLAVSRFSLSAAKMFKLVSSDGQPHVSQLALPPGFPPLAEFCDRALRLGEPIVREFTTDVRLWRLSCAPYTNQRGEIQGGTLFVTFSDEASELAMLLDQMPGRMLHRTRHGRILRASRAAAEDLGHTTMSIVDRNIYDLLDPVTADEARREAEEFLDSTRDQDALQQDRTIEETGERLVLAVERRRHRSRDGEETIFATAQNITELVEKEEELSRVNAALRLVLDKAPFYLLHRDRDGRILNVSDAYCRLMGKDPAKMVGKTLHDFFVSDDADAILAGGIAALDGAAGSDRAVMHIATPSGRRVFDIARVVLPGPQGGNGTICSVATDVTDATEERERSQDDIARLEHALSDAGVSVMQLNSHGRILKANPKAAEILKSGVDGLVGSTIAQVLTADSAAAFMGRLFSFLESDRSTDAFLFSLVLADDAENPIPTFRIWKRIGGAGYDEAEVLSIGYVIPEQV